MGVYRFPIDRGPHRLVGSFHYAQVTSPDVRLRSWSTLLRRRRRSEFLAAEVDRFFAQPGVATALLLIDYSEIPLDADGRRAGAESPDAHTFTDALLTSALRVHTEFKNDTESFDPPEMLAREAFDELLTGFERFDHHIQIGLIDITDARVYLGYWVEKLADPDSGWKPPAFYSALARFVEAYEYRGAAHLFEAFNHSLPSLGVSQPGSGRR